MDEELDTSTEIREVFVPFANISTVEERTVDIGQGRSYTELVWNEPIDDLHVPGLESFEMAAGAGGWSDGRNWAQRIARDCSSADAALEFAWAERENR